MSRGRLVSGRSRRVVSYHVGQKPAPMGWYRKRVGWFGKSLALTLVVTFFAFTWGMRWSLFAAYNVQYSTKTVATAGGTLQTTKAPDLAEGIVNLQPVFDKWAKDHPSQHWSVAVKSLDGQAFDVSLNGDDTYSIDGSYRLFLTLPLFTQMTLEKQQQTMVTTTSGSRQVLSKCVDLMLRISDNNCGVAASKYVSISRANALFKQDGFTHTSFVGSATKLKTTANDTARFMMSLNGSMFDQSSQALVVNALKNQIFRTGIPAACPGCQEADYSGFSGGSVYDAAVVDYSRGKYVLAIFSDNGSGFEDISKLAGQIHQHILDAVK